MWASERTLIAGSVLKERSGHLPRFIQRYSFLGDSSYSLYLVHILLIDIFLSAFLEIFSNPGSSYVVVYLVLCALSILSVAIAYVLYEVIERRMVGLLQTMVRSPSGPKVRNEVS